MRGCHGYATEAGEERVQCTAELHPPERRGRGGGTPRRALMNEQNKHTFILNYVALREEICLNSVDFSLKNYSTATEMNVCHFSFDTRAQFFSRNVSYFSAA